MLPSRSWRERAGSQISQSLRQFSERSGIDVLCTAQEAGRTLLRFGPSRDFVSVHAAAGLDPASCLHDAGQEYLSLFHAELVEQDGETAAHQRVCAEILLQLRPPRGLPVRRRLCPTRAASMKRTPSATS